VLDPHELELPFEGVTLFASLEDDRRLLAHPRSVRSASLRALHAYLARTRRALGEGDVEHMLVATSQPLEKTLLDFLTARAGRRPRRLEG
jgi:hypothetical protein